MERLLIWRGLDEWRAEVAHVRIDDGRLTATGTQLGVTPAAYRVDYSLRTGADFVAERLELSALHEGRLRRLLIERHPDGGWTADDRPLPELEGALDFDVLNSPVFNSTPYLRHEMGAGGEARDMAMAFVTVPDLAVKRSEQRYKPLGNATVNYASGDFSADIHFDSDGLVTLYEDYLEGVRPLNNVKGSDPLTI
ncbi:MAG TPA: putative glycolipid-binding domain-containing protein [Thermoleophilaceae bacterium]